MPSRDAPIAYVLGTFPQPSQTFIAREVRGLLAAGVNLAVFSLRRHPSWRVDPDDRTWAARIRFAPLSLSPTVLSASWHYARMSPRRYIRAFTTIFSLAHRPRILRARTVPLFLVAAWIAREIERAGGCRQIHAHFALAQTEVAMAVAVLLDRPFSFTAHARDIYATPSALVEKMRAASLVVTCTAHNVDYLRRLCPDLPANRIQLVYHGIDLAGWQREQGSGNRDQGPGTPLLLAAGRLVKKKGFDVLIDACARLRDQGVAFHCRLVGDGPQRAALARSIRRASLESVVELTRWLPPAELSALFSRATLFVAPSRVVDAGDRDGIPNVVIEAMAAECPVVSTRVSGIPEAVAHEVTGLLVPPDDPAALADAVGRLISDEVRRQTLGAAGRERVKERFDLSRSSERLAALFTRA
jgi:glycosyltransferase involved in cell wall biosynthesis